MAEKSERLLNLYIMLLAQTRFVSKQDIRRAHYGEYADNPRGLEAFEKAFERDKEDLRELGVVIEVGSLDSYFDDEQGYRISPDTSSLPEIRFEADEAAVLGIAARAWEQHTLARATTEAMRKLAAQGVEIDTSRLDLVPPSLRAEEPAFDACWEATQKRRVITFDYRRPGEEPATRRLQPWGVVRSSGRWYVVGLRPRPQGRARLPALPGAGQGDPDRQDSGVRRPGRHRRPGDRARPGRTARPDIDATVLVRQRAGVALRRQASAIEEDVVGPDDLTAWDRLSVSGQFRDLVSSVLSLGSNAVVEAPDELRADVVSRLSGVTA